MQFKKKEGRKTNKLEKILYCSGDGEMQIKTLKLTPQLTTPSVQRHAYHPATVTTHLQSYRLLTTPRALSCSFQVPELTCLLPEWALF